MSKYYCFVTGLPAMRLADAQPPKTVLQLKEELATTLTAGDARRMEAYFMRFDCENVVALLEDGDSPAFDPRGNYSREELEEMVCSARESERNDKRWPAFVQDFVRKVNGQGSTVNGQGSTAFAKDILMATYYAWAATSRDGMMAEWYALNMNILNILTALIARRQGWNIAYYIQGDNAVTESILKNQGSQDFGLGTEYDYVRELMVAAEAEDPVEKERLIDALKWHWLEEHTFFEPFDLDAVFSYVARTELLERWARLDVEQGKERFTQIIENLRGEAKVPEEYIRKTITKTKTTI